MANKINSPAPAAASAPAPAPVSVPAPTASPAAAAPSPAASGQPLNPVSGAFDTQTDVGQLASLLAASRLKTPSKTPKTPLTADPARQSPASAPPSPSASLEAGLGEALSAGTPGPATATPETPDPAVLEVPEVPEVPETPVGEGEPERETPDPALSKGVQKRINRLTAQKKSAEDALAKAQAELDQARRAAEQAPAAAPPAPAPVDAARPWAGAPEIAEISAQESSLEATAKLARHMLRRLEREPDAVLADLAKAKLDFPDPEAARDWLEQTSDDVAGKLESARAQRAVVEDRVRTNYAQQEQASMARANARHAWMKDQASPEFAQAVQIARAIPELRRFPEWREWLGFAVEGRQAFLARQAAAARPADLRPRPAPAPTPGGGARPGGVPQPVAQRAAALKAHTENPSLDTLARAVKAISSPPRADE